MTKKFYKKTFTLLVLFNLLTFVSASAQTVPKTPTLNIPAVPKVKDDTQTKQPVLFLSVLEKRLTKNGLTIEKFCPQDNIVTKRILTEYGAVFVGNGNYMSPCYFKDERTVQEAQKFHLGVSSGVIGGVNIELQPAAMNALLKAVDEARKQGLKITPRGGSIAARRSYAQTLALWNKRVNAGLDYWVKKRRLTLQQAKQIRAMQTFNQITEQIAEILTLEKQGIYFSLDFSKSIFYSVAPPGASQHNWMLALDVVQFSNPNVRKILADQGWFQTVKSDLPHFTYLGLKNEESELRSRGLYSDKVGTQTFWIPQMEITQ